MADITVADFYYGSVISVFLNKGITPALIERGEDRQIYDLMTDHTVAKLFVKYRTDKISTSTGDYNSWSFPLTSSDKGTLQRFIDNGEKILLALVCGTYPISESELALLDENDIKGILSLNKTSITISRKKNERKYRIAIGGGRANSMTIKCNRLKDIFSQTKTNCQREGNTYAG